MVIRLISGIVDYYIDLAPKVKASEETLIYTRATVSCASYPKAAVIGPHSTEMRKLYTAISEYIDHGNGKRRGRDAFAGQAFQDWQKHKEQQASGIT
jgi:hypothetical protein